MFECSLNLVLMSPLNVWIPRYLYLDTNALKWELNSVFCWEGISGLNLIRKSLKTQFRDRFTWKRYFGTRCSIFKSQRWIGLLKVKQKRLNPSIIVKTFSKLRWQTNTGFVTEIKAQFLKASMELEKIFLSGLDLRDGTFWKVKSFWSNLFWDSFVGTTFDPSCPSDNVGEFDFPKARNVFANIYSQSDVSKRISRFIFSREQKCCVCCFPEKVGFS